MSESYHPLRALYITRLREFYRQPARLFWVYGFPTVLAIGLGIAFRSPAAPTITADLIENSSSAELMNTIDAYNARRVDPDPIFKIKLNNETEAQRRLRTGKTPLVIEAIGPKSVTYYYDPSRPEAPAARSAIDDVLQRAAGRPNPVSTSDQRETKPGGRYIDFLIPGLIGQNTMGGGRWGVGFLLVNFRIGKLLKRFIATPMPRRDFLLALLGARMTFLIPDLAILMSLGHYGLGMPIKGSLWLIVVIVSLGGLAFAGIGLLVGSRAQTTETVSGLMNLVMLPMWIFSGVFFSSTRFKGPIQYFVLALPLTQLLNALRAVILKGAGLTDVSLSLVILALWAVLTFVLALKIFRWN